MSTLGTFAKYSDFGIIEDGRKKLEPGYAAKANSKPRVQYEIGQTDIKRQPIYEKGANLPYKSKRRAEKVEEGFGQLKKLKGIKMRNALVAAGLGTAGLAGLGATAYNMRNSNRRSEMSFGSAYANFAEALVGSKSGVSPITGKPYTNKSKEFGEVTDAMRTGTGTPLTPEQLDKLKTSKNNKKQFDKTQIEDTQKSLKAYANQRGIEKQIDSGGDIYKGAKGAGDYVNRTSALLTSPERKAIAAGKTSKNSFVKGLSEGAEKFGRAGYKTGATGLRGVGNALVGRTVTGKVARLGAAGIGLSAIGGAMKRNRQERG